MPTYDDKQMNCFLLLKSFSSYIVSHLQVKLKDAQVYFDLIKIVVGIEPLITIDLIFNSTGVSIKITFNDIAQERRENL